jgi:hypothetical protein
MEEAMEGENAIISGISELVEKSYGTAREKGWHESERPFGEIVALIHSELSEALEEYRAGRGNFYLGTNGKPEGIAVEFADAIIRIADAAGELGLDLPGAILAKLEYNRTRPYRHGGKIA